MSNVYGLNYDATVRDAMGINNMPADIKVLEFDYFNFIGTGDDEEADKTLKMIQKLTICVCLVKVYSKRELNRLFHILAKEKTQ